jgi:hypothetical protein
LENASVILIKPEVLASSRGIVNDAIQALLNASILCLKVVHKACKTFEWSPNKEEYIIIDKAGIILTFELPVHNIHLAKYITFSLARQPWPRSHSIQLVSGAFQLLIHFYILGLHIIHHPGILGNLPL